MSGPGHIWADKSDLLKGMVACELCGLIKNDTSTKPCPGAVTVTLRFGAAAKRRIKSAAPHSPTEKTNEPG